MDPEGKAQQVWIFIGESDQWHGRPLSFALLDLLKRNGIAGATVLRGVAGYGAHHFVHTALLVELSGNLPLVVTFVDRPDRVARVMPEVSAMVTEGLITATTVEIVKYATRVIGPFPEHLTVADVMSRDVAYTLPETPVGEIVMLLIDRALRSIPVVDSVGRVMGMITDGDLLRRGAMALPLTIQRDMTPSERAAFGAAASAEPRTAADLMTPDPLTLAQTLPLAQAAAVMAARGLKRMPVVDDRDRLVGMVSRSDLLATIAEGLGQRPAETIERLEHTPQTVGEIMMTNIPTVHAETPLSETVDRLLETDKRRVVVIDEERRVVGIISDGDILRRATKTERLGAIQALAAWFGGAPRPAALEVDAAGRTAADVMSAPVVTLPAGASVAAAIRLMMTHTIKRIPIVDADGRFVGLVGRAGVLTALNAPPSSQPRDRQTAAGTE